MQINNNCTKHVFVSEKFKKTENVPEIDNDPYPVLDNNPVVDLMVHGTCFPLAVLYQPAPVQILTELFHLYDSDVSITKCHLWHGNW